MYKRKIKHYPQAARRVFCQKFIFGKPRHKVFVEPYRNDFKEIIRKIGYDYNIEIVELEVPVDYIHMVVRTESKISPSYVMQVIKSILGGKLWAQSYFVEMMGNVTEDIIRICVQDQLTVMDEGEKSSTQLGLF